MTTHLDRGEEDDRVWAELLDDLADPRSFEHGQLSAPTSDEASNFRATYSRPGKRAITSEEEILSARKNGGVYVKRRPRGGYVTYMVRPRILKCDVRRCFPQMYCNLLNAPDTGAMVSFLDTFAAQIMFFNHTFYGQCSPDGSNVHRIGLEGSQHVGKFWSSLSDMVPDKTCSVTAAQVRARSDGTSVVTCELDWRGSILIRATAPPPWQWMHDEYVAPDASQSQAPVENAPSSSSMESCDVEETPPPDLGALVLMQTRSIVRVGFHLDEQNQIQQLDFEMIPATMAVQGAV